jgi:G3E family GTPase
MNDAPQRRKPPAPLPLNVLTGFLGAGKTTLLNRLLKDPALANAAVIINEFGEIGLDHLLVEHIEDGVMLLSTGCLCCTMRGDLIETMEKLLRGLDNGRMSFNRVIIETTGLADPAPVLHTAMVHPYLMMRFRLDGVITVVDAVNGASTLDNHIEAVKQVAVADRIVLTKSDLAADTTALRARLAALNPAAPVIDAQDATIAQLVNCGLYDPDRKTPDVKRWLAEEAYAASHDHHHHHHDVNRHDANIHAFALTSDTPIPYSAFEMFLDLVRSMHGPNLLRVKGIVQLAETPDQPVVIHGVQHVFHPPATLSAWPDADHRTRLVFIVNGIEERAIRDLFDAFRGTTAIDRPDRAALADNPLTPFGGADHLK